MPISRRKSDIFCSFLLMVIRIAACFRSYPVTKNLQALCKRMEMLRALLSLLLTHSVQGIWEYMVIAEGWLG